jgi:hypothetical protein
MRVLGITRKSVNEKGFSCDLSNDMCPQTHIYPATMPRYTGPRSRPSMTSLYVSSTWSVGSSHVTPRDSRIHGPATCCVHVRVAIPERSFDDVFFSIIDIATGSPRVADVVEFIGDTSGQRGARARNIRILRQNIVPADPTAVATRFRAVTERAVERADGQDAEWLERLRATPKPRSNPRQAKPR